MHSLKSIRVKGLRSIIDSNTVNLKPINILVGTNSSGKSSFLRLFPLLSQSVERRTRGPILWNGPLVDFESIENTLSSSLDPNNDCISLTFVSTIDGKIASTGLLSRLNSQVTDVEIASTISISKGKKPFTSFTKKYILAFDDDHITFTFSEGGELIGVDSERLVWDVNSKTEQEEIAKYSVSETDSIIPFFRTGRNYFHFGGWGLNNTSKDASQVIRESINSTIVKLTKGSDKERISLICRKLSSVRGSDTKKLKEFKKIINYSRAQKVTAKWTVDDAQFKFISGQCNLLFALEFSEALNSYLTGTFKNIHYIAPLRASTERYYRFQDLNIDQLDHTGSNLAMFVSALPPKWQKSLDEWTKISFDFTVKVDYSSSNLALKIAYGNGGESYNNVTDMGFGFSQILPILVSLWSVSSGYENNHQKNISKQVIFAIEQPELHLHPRMQASLANVFSSAVKLAKENGITLNLIIETHSEALISTIGDLIAIDEIDKDTASILVFEQDRIERTTEIRTSNFLADGTLESWPKGFFSY
ncbi:AAA family ATPase [Shewanella saliphila]|uniref:Endonuclease GajA/Old nuclease/RecF-like AAA domain-containing protein n=1 Tax=Shewanella saliphila TaxID=2282698 RepID=A0ABQ2QAZ5_9GAMM|nr:AAA family ATPase [Shewanella saliphila]MCL1103479.1 AAA family ATPase [Shewanella saliphila]GGP69865.1 hypothetical protein GCM10009409_38220 [Shewanella saliphila]